MNRQLAEQYFKRADRHYRAGEYSEALPLLNVLDSAFPDSKNVLFARARCLAQLGKTNQARTILERLVEEFEAPRAAALLAQLDATSAAESFGDLDEALNAAPFANVKYVAPPKEGLRLPVVLTVIVAFGALAIGFAVLFDLATRRMNLVQDDVPVIDVAEAQSRRRTELHERRLEQAQSPTPHAGYVHSEEVWRLTADENGVPDWKPGVYLDVRCVGPEPWRTIDVYLPMAYQEKPDALFPTLTITMPRPKVHGFLDLEKWAERQEVILIALNSSSNRTHHLNWKAQDAAINTLLATMRIDTRLGFATGTSGGAQTALLLAYRYPENIAGVVMMARGGDWETVRGVSSELRIAFLNGNTDFNHDEVTEVAAYFRQRGNEVRRQVFPGGHRSAPTALLTQMLDWVVSDARRDLGVPIPQ